MSKESKTRLNWNFELSDGLERGKVSIQLGENHQQMQPFLLHYVLMSKLKANLYSSRGKKSFHKLSSITLFLLSCLCCGLAVQRRKSKYNWVSDIGLTWKVSDCERCISLISFNVSVPRDVTAYLRLLLRKEGFNFHSSSELEIVRTIKEVRQ